MSIKREYRVQGMDCADCALKIEDAVRRIGGIRTIHVDFMTSRLKIEAEDSPDLDRIITGAVEAKGYRIAGGNPGIAPVSHKGPLLELMLSVILLGSGLVLHYLHVSRPYVITMLMAAIVIGGYRIIRKALKDIRTNTLGIDVLMSIAVTGAMIIGEWFEAAVVIILFALAEWLESVSVEKARKSIASLFDIVPVTAPVVIDGVEREIVVQEIEKGQVVRIKPGARVPLDGIVIRGTSAVDQSPITGESKPAEKSSGDSLYAGSVNQTGVLEMEVTGTYENTTLSHIIRIVEEAQSKKTTAQKFINRFSRIYTPAVVSLAVLMVILWPLIGDITTGEAVYRALVMLVIACPCALVLATPVAVTSALNRAARNGILLKGGTYLEQFDRIEAIAFDKTGTLTYGKVAVHDIILLNTWPEDKVLHAAASLESFSEHHFARAILDYAKMRNITPGTPSSFRAIPGKGVEGIVNGTLFRLGNRELFGSAVQDRLPELGNNRNGPNDLFSSIVLGTESELLAVILLSDSIRHNAGDAVTDLERAGVRHVIMLSGDRNDIAVSVAAEAGIREFRGELLPEQKLDVVAELERNYGHIAMVGDGINDAPALARASIGVAMGISGTDLALETADVVLMNDDLHKLSFLKRLSRRTVRTIKENILIALGLKLIFFVLAVPGLATLWMAVFADMGASLIVIANGMKLLRR